MSRHNSKLRSSLNAEMNDISYHWYCVKSIFLGVGFMDLTIMRNQVCTLKGDIPFGEVVPDVLEAIEVFAPKKPLC